MYNAKLTMDLTHIYNDIMHLSRSPGNTPARAKAWYSSVKREQFKTQVCVFTGFVSEAAINDYTGKLVLEHFNRLQKTLSGMIQRHSTAAIHDPDDFVQLIYECEQVHITTNDENRTAKMAEGDYSQAGIKLVAWDDIPNDIRTHLWTKKLKGKVSNAIDYK